MATVTSVVLEAPLGLVEAVHVELGEVTPYELDVVDAADCVDCVVCPDVLLSPVVADDVPAVPVPVPVEDWLWVVSVQVFDEVEPADVADEALCPLVVPDDAVPVRDVAPVVSLAVLEVSTVLPVDQVKPVEDLVENGTVDDEDAPVAE